MKSLKPTLFYGTPLSHEAVECLEKNGLHPVVPSQSPTAAPRAVPSEGLVPLTSMQSQIHAALTGKPMNIRQTELLSLYYRAWLAGEPYLTIAEAAERLAERCQLDDDKKATDYVSGALRSFGRRLYQNLSKVPLKVGRDRTGDGVADEVPLLALLDIQVGPSGEKRHKMTDEGAVAVAAALGLSNAGYAAAGFSTGDAALDDLEEVITVSMTRRSASLLKRVQTESGASFDEAIRHAAAMCGAG